MTEKVVAVGKTSAARVHLMDIAEENVDDLRTMSYTCDTVFLICFSMKHATPDAIHRVKAQWIPVVQRACPNPYIIILATQCLSMNVTGVSLFPEILRLWDYCRDGYEKDIKITNLMQVDSKKDLRGVNELFTYASSLPLNPRKYFTGPEDQKLALVKGMLIGLESAVEKTYTELSARKPNISSQITSYDPSPGFWLSKVDKCVNSVDQIIELSNNNDIQLKNLEEWKLKFTQLHQETKSYVEEMEAFIHKYREVQRQRDSKRIEEDEKKRKNAVTGPLQFCDVCGHPKKDDTDRLLKVLGKLYHKKCFRCNACGIKMEDVGLKFYELDKQPVCLACKKESIR